MCRIPKGWCAAVKADLRVVSVLNHDLVDCNIRDFSHASPDDAKFVCRNIIKCARSPFSNLDITPCKPKNLTVGVPPVHHCPSCSYVTDTLQKINLHKLKCFGWKDPIRLYIPADITYCLSCLVDHHKRENLINHI